ncbi:MAG: TrkA family potassium uptake protein [Rhodospirillales bacterium]|nr:TrkA family potassium uptake protein [Rhodospirillales bacterium]
MRFAFVGAGATAVGAAKMLIRGGHEVILVDIDPAKIKILTEEIDCGLVAGDGSKPAVLRDVGPADTELLVCVTDNDETNILATLVARSLGFRRIVTKIEEPEFEHICVELGLEDIIIPSRDAAQRLADIATGALPEEVSRYFKAGARMFSFVAGETAAGPVAKLDLPSRCRVMCLYRKGELIVADADTTINSGDEVVLFTHEKNLPQLKERWVKSRANGQTP